MADDIFDNDGGQPIEVGFNDLVGEGRKYTNPDDLAKAYAHSESFIEQLKGENAQLRAAQDAQRATNNQNPNPDDRGQEPLPGQTNGSEAPKQNSSPSEPIDYRSQIRDEIRALNDEERAKANRDLAAGKMVELYGSVDGAKQAVEKRAQELGVSPDWLRDSASRSPEAFFATMGINAGGTDRSTPAPRPEVRLGDTSNVKNFEYFDRIRKENPKLYFTAATQREMMNQARTMGADFYKR